jgi:hypothetical protein
LDFFKLEKIQRCRDSIEIALLYVMVFINGDVLQSNSNHLIRKSKLERYEQNMGDKQQQFSSRMAELDKKEKDISIRLQKVARREEAVMQKEKQVQEKLQGLVHQVRFQESEQIQGSFGQNSSITTMREHMF